MKIAPAFKKIPLACLIALLLPCAMRAKTDKTDLPFADDPAVLGRWQSVAYADRIEGFSPADVTPAADLFFKSLEFLPGGKTDNSMLSSWTKGVIISTEAKTACKYRIERLSGRDYLFFEWKAGDYVLRDEEPGYYVMVRARDYAKAAAGAGKDPGAPEVKTYDCLNPGLKPAICRRPASTDYSEPQLASLPGYQPDSGKMWQLDLRGMDVSGLDLAGRTTDLVYADFDSRTKFPAKLPEGFDPREILEQGKNPGLGVRALHAKGLTGKGVGIGIIDQPLLVGHKEYAAALKSYEEMHMFNKESSAAMHGPAVASIAVGTTCGVAPDADLYYIATDFVDSLRALDFKYLAAAIDRLLAISGTLPNANRIRVISISRGFSGSDRGAAELLASIEKAKKAGVMVLTTSPRLYYDFAFMGLGKEPASDPDASGSYGPGLFWQKNFFSGNSFLQKEPLLVPMDSRTTASPTGEEDYVFYRNGGLSWATPYIAGLYALACQADPGITPEAFFKKAMETAGAGTIKKDGREFTLKGIVSPAALLAPAPPAAEKK